MNRTDTKLNAQIEHFILEMTAFYLYIVYTIAASAIGLLCCSVVNLCMLAICCMWNTPVEKHSLRITLAQELSEFHI